MTPLDRWVLSILVAGNLLLVADSVRDRGQRSFDLAAVAARTREVLGEPGLARVRFAEESLLPDDYLYLEAPVGRPVQSVYVGYHPRQGPFQGTPHDPTVCYRSFGWSIERWPEPVAVPGAPEEPVAWAEQMLVRRDDERRVVLYWLQASGRLPGREGGSGLWDRLWSGRSDLVWVRLEIDPEEIAFPLDARWAARLRGHMLALLGEQK